MSTANLQGHMGQVPVTCLIWNYLEDIGYTPTEKFELPLFSAKIAESQDSRTYSARLVVWDSLYSPFILK